MPWVRIAPSCRLACAAHEQGGAGGVYAPPTPGCMLAQLPSLGNVHQSLRADTCCWTRLSIGSPFDWGSRPCSSVYSSEFRCARYSRSFVVHNSRWSAHMWLNELNADYAISKRWRTSALSLCSLLPRQIQLINLYCGLSLLANLIHTEQLDFPHDIPHSAYDYTSWVATHVWTMLIHFCKDPNKCF